MVAFIVIVISFIGSGHAHSVHKRLKQKTLWTVGISDQARNLGGQARPSKSADVTDEERHDAAGWPVVVLFSVSMCLRYDLGCASLEIGLKTRITFVFFTHIYNARNKLLVKFTSN